MELFSSEACISLGDPSPALTCSIAAIPTVCVDVQYSCYTYCSVPVFKVRHKRMWHLTSLPTATWSRSGQDLSTDEETDEVLWEVENLRGKLYTSCLQTLDKWCRTIQQPISRFYSSAELEENIVLLLALYFSELLNMVHSSWSSPAVIYSQVLQARVTSSERRLAGVPGSCRSLPPQLLWQNPHICNSKLPKKNSALQ